MSHLSIGRTDGPLKPKRKRRSWLEQRVAAWLGESGLPQPISEFRFAPPRFFRFDFCWPALGVALECEGGIWTRGRHSRGTGYVDDCDKNNLAVMLGWRLLKVTERHVRDGSAFELITRALTTPIRYVPTVLVEQDDSSQKG